MHAAKLVSLVAELLLVLESERGLEKSLGSRGLHEADL